MTIDSRLRQVAAGLCFAVLTGAAYAAGGGTLDLALPSDSATNQAPRPFMLAANEVDVVTANTSSGKSPVVPAAEFEPSFFSGSNAHQYMGLGTIALAALTGMTAPEECESAGCTASPREMNGTHAKLAYATTALAAATIATGLIYHWDDFSFEDGITDPDNLHVILGATGAALMALAVQASASKSTGQVSHAGQAMAGAAGMAIAIKLTW